MANNRQLEKHNSLNTTAQLNVAISKDSKKKFMSFCLEHDLAAKEAAEKALLEFIEKRKAE